jgi:hypothetical protein
MSKRKREEDDDDGEQQQYEDEEEEEEISSSFLDAVRTNVASFSSSDVDSKLGKKDNDGDSKMEINDFEEEERLLLQQPSAKPVDAPPIAYNEWSMGQQKAMRLALNGYNIHVNGGCGAGKKELSRALDYLLKIKFKAKGAVRVLTSSRRMAEMLHTNTLFQFMGLGIAKHKIDILCKEMLAKPNLAEN